MKKHISSIGLTVPTKCSTEYTQSQLKFKNKNHEERQALVTFIYINCLKKFKLQNTSSCIFHATGSGQYI